VSLAASVDATSLTSREDISNQVASEYILE